MKIATTIKNIPISVWLILHNEIISTYHYKISQKTYNQKYSTILFLIIDCLRNDVDEKLVKNDINCTFPWVESMRGILNYTEEEKPTCKRSDDYHILDRMTMNLAASASAYNHQKCLGKLKFSDLLKFNS